MKPALWFIGIVIAALLIVACRNNTRWLPSERWPANPATLSIYGEWKCEDAPGGFNQPTRIWKPRLGKDNYYWCWVKDATERSKP